MKIEVGDVYGEAWALFKANLAPSLTITAVMLALAVVIPGALVGVGFVASDMEHQQYIPLIACGVAAYFILIAVILAGVLAMNALHLDALYRRPVSVGAAFSRGLSKSFVFFVAALLGGFAYIGGLMLCCIPGFIVIFGLVLMPSVVVEEDVGPVDALKRSWALTDGHKVDVFISYLVWMFISMAVGIVTLIIGTVLAAAIPSDAASSMGGMPVQLIPQLIGQAIQMVLTFFMMPFQTALFCVMYERRTRRLAPPAAEVAQVFT